jgi:hypothetical protein
VVSVINFAHLSNTIHTSTPPERLSRPLPPLLRLLPPAPRLHPPPPLLPAPKPPSPLCPPAPRLDTLLRLSRARPQTMAPLLPLQPQPTRHLPPRLRSRPAKLSARPSAALSRTRPASCMNVRSQVLRLVVHMRMW